mmetsp:Transcript_34509/g.35102  ORF Transcript_34509/g.35102 Transcript_34509/m.35102 type:complete len:100 (+) Transcript_34509:172-471(+)
MEVFLVKVKVKVKENDGVDSSQYKRTEMATNMCMFMVVFFLPIIFVIYITITAWSRGFIPSATGSAVSGSQLALYFFRIVVVFCIVWIPASLCMVAKNN